MKEFFEERSVLLFEQARPSAKDFMNDPSAFHKKKKDAFQRTGPLTK